MYEIISANKLISSRFNFENNISIAIHENSVLFYVTFFVRLFPSRNAKSLRKKGSNCFEASYQTDPVSDRNWKKGT